MSRPANVAIGKSRGRQMSRPAEFQSANVATGRISVGKCRDWQVSRSVNVAIGKSPTGDVSVSRCRTIELSRASKWTFSAPHGFFLLPFDGSWIPNWFHICKNSLNWPNFVYVSYLCFLCLADFVIKAVERKAYLLKVIKGEAKTFAQSAFDKLSFVQSYHKNLTYYVT